VIIEEIGIDETLARIGCLLTLSYGAGNHEYAMGFQVEILP
jgi:hypothetical protein